MTTTKTQFPNRHLESDQRATLTLLLDNCGPAEILRTIGQWVATEHVDADEGDHIRTALNAAARKLSVAARRD